MFETTPISVLLVGSTEQIDRIRRVLTADSDLEVKSCEQLSTAEAQMWQDAAAMICFVNDRSTLAALDGLGRDRILIALTAGDQAQEFDLDFPSSDWLILPADISANLLHRALRQALKAKQGEAILQEQFARLETSMREVIGMEQREDFMATLTHDLKTPLVGANMVLGAMLDGTLGALLPQQVEILGKLKSSNIALLKMIQNLLEVYRYEAGSEALLLREVDLIPLINFSIDEVRPLLTGKNLHLEWDPVHKPILVIADDDALKRVFINLLGNAIKFTPEGGTLQIDAEDTKPNVCVHFKDSGVGISEQDKERLFQRFWQGGSRKYSVGTGLGLYFCQKVVEAHKGSIICHSEIGQGTTFSVTLPAVVPASRKNAE